MTVSYAPVRKTRYSGALVGVPVSGVLYQSLVIWHSSRYKNVILVAVSNESIGIQDSSLDIGKFIGLWFTSAQLIREGDWKFQGLAPPQNVPEPLITFESAGNIHVGDEYQGPARSRSKVQRLSVCGGVAVQKQIAECLKGEIREEQKPAIKLLKKHRKFLRKWALSAVPHAGI